MFWHMLFILFRILLFTKTAGKKYHALSLNSHFFFGQQCKSADLSKFCLSDKKRKSQREHFEI